MTKSSKQKGDAFERELAAHINGKTGLSCFRAPLSGGGHGLGFSTADILGTPMLHVEAKRVERLNFYEAIEQAERSINRTKSQDMPIVVNRRNGMKTGDSVVALRLDDFLGFYAYYLRAKGYVDKPDQ